MQVSKGGKYVTILKMFLLKTNLVLGKHPSSVVVAEQNG